MVWIFYVVSHKMLLCLALISTYLTAYVVDLLFRLIIYKDPKIS